MRLYTLFVINGENESYRQNLWMSRCDERLKPRVEESWVYIPHIHWVARQNKLELPNEEEEVNTRDIHKCDGQAHDPDTMTAPLTPKPTRKAEALVRASSTIASRHKEDATLKEVVKPRLCCANGIFETKTKDGSTVAKAPDLQGSSLFIFSRIKKRRNPKVKLVTLLLCEVKKNRSNFYEKVPTCAS